MIFISRNKWNWKTFDFLQFVVFYVEACLIFLEIQEWTHVKKFAMSISILNLFVDKMTYFEKQVKVIPGHVRVKIIPLVEML